jgi:DNA polymerase I-like protein with 3'-5' exonuclease and polymerase domains
MGVDSKVAKNAAQVLLASDPELSAWFAKVEKEVASTRMIHSWGGGRRVFYWVERADQVEEMKRQARNFPPQGGGADLYNLAIVEVCEQVPEVRFVYGMHDSLWFSCPWGLWVKVFSRVKEILTKPRIINGMAVHFPMSMKVMYDDGRVEKVS